MIYGVGDVVEVCAKRGLPWFEGIVEEVSDRGILVKFTKPPLSSGYLGVKRPVGRDHKVEKVLVPKHLEMMGVGWQTIKLKRKASK